MAGYTRRSLSEIINGLDVTAPPLNNEFNQLEAAFSGTSGHSHDGTTGNAPKIGLSTSVSGYLPPAHGGVGGRNNVSATSAPVSTDDGLLGYSAGSLWINTTNGRAYRCVSNGASAAVWREEVQIQDGTTIVPLINAAVDMGTSGSRFKDAYLSGTLNATKVTGLTAPTATSDAANKAYVDSVAGSATAAAASATAAATSLATFQNQYHGPRTTAPITNVDAGDIYYDTIVKSMLVYDGLAWNPVVQASLGGIRRAQYVVSVAGQTTFSAGGTFSFAQVYKDGVKLLVTVDYTEASPDIVLATGVPVGTTIDIFAYQANDTTDYYTKSATDARYVQLATDQTIGGIKTFQNPIVGSGANLTALNAANIATGTISDARLPANIVRNTLTLVGGDGMQAVGDLSANRTLAVDSSVVRLTAVQTLTNKTLTAPTITGALISSTALTGGTISNATVTGGTISGATITSPTITGATLSSAALASATISGSTFTNGTITTAAISNSTINGGSISGIVDLSVADGGTGASDAATARSNLGAAAAATAINAGVGLTGGGTLAADRTVALTGQALALHNLATNGLVARTAAGTVAARTLTGGTAITITNGDGVNGNPTAAFNGSIGVTGVTTNIDNDGTISSGIYTPNVATGNVKYIENAGAFTFAAPFVDLGTSFTLVVVMGSSATAGAVTMSGFNRVTGDAFTTANGNAFLIFIAVFGNIKTAVVQALQ